MKNRLFSLTCILTLLISLSSCSLEKKRYSLGYHFEWNHGKKNDAAAVKGSRPQHQVPMAIGSKAIEMKTFAESKQDDAMELASVAPMAVASSKSTSHHGYFVNHSKSLSHITRSELKSKISWFKKSSSLSQKPSQSKDTASVLKIIGIVLMVIGVLNVLSFSVVGGLILILLGALLYLYAYRF